MTNFFSSHLWKTKTMHIVCILLAITQVICARFQFEDPNLFIITGIFLISLIGFELLYVCLYKLLLKNESLNRVTNWIQKHESYLFWFVLLFVFWLPHLIAWFPGGISADSAWQIEQILHVYQLTTHHPIINSVLIGIFVKIGTMLGSANLGVYMFVTLQTIFSAAVMAYTLQTMKDLNTKVWMRVFSFVLYAFMPNYTGFIAVVLKDMIYSMFFVLMVTMIIRYEVLGVRDFKPLFKKCLWVIAVFGVLSMRNNGIHIFVLTMIWFILYALIHKKDIKFIVLACMIPFVLYLGVNEVFTRYFKPINDDTAASTLSIPMQQTARYARDYGDEVTDEEYELISTVLPYEELGEAYDPVISDPIKIRFKMEATSSDVMTYLKGWLLQLPKHFDTYVDATLEQNQYFFDFWHNNNNYYAIEEVLAYDKAALDQTGIMYSNEEIEKQSNLKQFYSIIDQIPFVRLFNNLAVYNVLFCFIIGWTISEKRKEHLYMIPLLLQCLVNFAGPVIFMHQRYFFPIIFTISMLLAIYFRNGHFNESEIKR